MAVRKQAFLVLAGVLFVCVVTVSTAARLGQTRWEYKLEPTSGGIDAVPKQLNDAGDQGWELVQVVREGEGGLGNSYLVFRRQK
jgi:hypothetical protein